MNCSFYKKLLCLAMSAYMLALPAFSLELDMSVDEEIRKTIILHNWSLMLCLLFREFLPQLLSRLRKQPHRYRPQQIINLQNHFRSGKLLQELDEFKRLSLKQMRLTKALLLLKSGKALSLK